MSSASVKIQILYMLFHCSKVQVKSNIIFFYAISLSHIILYLNYFLCFIIKKMRYMLLSVQCFYINYLISEFIFI